MGMAMRSIANQGTTVELGQKAANSAIPFSINYLTFFMFVLNKLFS
jgi:hypothetical protein